ncbi:hypothetical protein PGTUg99_024837 [Puccinia graminis f. sp. tritici]|uniref:Uncharacterized protein n=1 Tax=Puccinia graminis f. sp. tritici TaxID=56615 RepID=A0A5B0RS98_PUCGR|nr:hypothetical protein PGTUg99_024837 [Puccinia graminis f. sp. tritici]
MLSTSSSLDAISWSISARILATTSGFRIKWKKVHESACAVVSLHKPPKNSSRLLAQANGDVDN